DAAVGLYSLERWRASLRYYLGRPIARLDTPDDLAAFVSAHHPAYVVLRRHDFETLRAAGVPLREVLRHRAVIGTSGNGVRRQVWGYVVVATNAPPRARR
ncbi:MAG TPA: hypothetical protein VEL79_14745, partial [Vicinamibacterales bacterium]|nr:hypothetical protein [Vicinamibacterales bacterium]